MYNIVFGAIYTENANLRRFLPCYFDRLNDQKQHCWFPIRVKNDREDNIYMVDTYQFDMPYEYQNNYADMISYLRSLGDPEDHSWLKNKVADYFYSAAVKIDEDSASAFSLLANLEEYEIVDEEQARYYDQKNVIRRARFWNYHNSGRGVMLKRKNAPLRYDLKIDSLYDDVSRDFRFPDVNFWSMKEFLACEKEAIEKNATYDKNKVEYVVKMNEYIENAQGQFQKFKEKLIDELDLRNK